MKVITTFVALAVLVAAATALTTEEQFQEWMGIHGKVYDHIGEEQYRTAVWARNAEFIRQHNAKGLSYTLAMNEFGDMTHAEFSQHFLAAPMDVELWNSTVSSLPVGETETVGSGSVDWRKKGAVGPVKNQGQCGSCWSFSATGSMEGIWQIAGHSLVSLSEQQLMDCSGKYGNMGCNGGLPANAFLYVIDAGGIETEHDYPYVTRMNSQCKYDSSKKAAHFSNAYQVKRGDDGALASSIQQYGPVAIAIDASQPSFQFYSSGIYKEPRCSSTQLDHGVVAVGYTDDAWIVRNSWGSSWGEQGYIMMDRSTNDFCGVSTMAAFPQV